MPTRVVVVAGSSGFLGSHLVSALRERGHEVVRLVRNATDDPRDAVWDPYAGHVDQALIDRADVVINLAGAPTLGNPHSKKWARDLEASRVITTEVLASAISDSPTPAAFIAGNGISWYGDHGDELLPETADSRGDALLTKVTRVWQEATAPALAVGARVVVLRTSPVLDASTPPLSLLIKLFRAGGTQRLGSGKQYFPIISLRDWVGAVVHLTENDDVSGPVNLCCEVTPTNAEFTDVLAVGLRRTMRFGVPAALIRIAAGAMAPELLGSVRAVPQALIDAGYTFHDPGVVEVVQAGLAQER